MRFLGAFITSTNHYLKLHHPHTNFHYTATTLNPYYEGNALGNAILDDRFILHTMKNWFFGDEYNGDILNTDNIYSLIAHCKSQGDIDMVTADGSCDCLDNPEHQEEYVSKLHTAEFITILALLNDRGSMLLKLFTFYELSTISMLYVLNCCFTSVHLFKPACSKEGNSEVYVIGIGYKKHVMTEAHIKKIIENFMISENSLLPLNTLPVDFLTQVTNAARFFMNKQVNVIEGNIRTFMKYDKQECFRIKSLKEETVNHYLKLYNVRSIPENQKLLQGVRFNSDLNSNIRVHSGSHADRISFHNLTNSDKLQVLYDRLKHFYDTIYSNTKEDNSLRLEGINMTHREFIKFIRGRAIEKIMSSKFILVTIMKYFMELRSFMEDLKNDDFIQENSENYSTNGNIIKINIHYFRTATNYDQYEKEITKLILNQIIDFQHEIFIISDFLLLTQFLVGVILYLGCFVYKEIYFDMSSSSIKFSVLRDDDGIKNAKYLLDQLTSGRNGTNLGILGICNVWELLITYKELHKLVIDFNNVLCLKYCSGYLNKISLK